MDTHPRTPTAGVLVVNAGSSSLKLSLLAAGSDEPTWSAETEPGRLPDALGSLESLEGIDAVGHRIVHGGSRFREPVLVDAEVREALEDLVALAPLHQPGSLAALDAVSAALPAVPAVACFDTAFHGTLTPAAATYAIPAAWRERWQLRRYGFHGLSHAWVARRVAELLGRPGDQLRIVSCHLGAGASLCAIAGGRSVDTTMGFTPLEGLVMATRSGSVDPGLLLWLLERTGLSERELAQALEHESGLKALAGTADMRRVLAGAARGEPDATLARDVYVHRLRGAIAAMAASAGGVDALAFTGGVGERSAEIRGLACGGLGFLGIAVAPAANAEATGTDADVSAPNSAVRTLVVRAREDLEVAAQVRRLLSARAGPGE